MFEHRVHDRPRWDDVIARVEEWDADRGTIDALHAGDLGWNLRETDEVSRLHTWWDGTELAAVALLDGSVARPRVGPGRAGDAELAAAVATELSEMPGPRLWSDAAAGSALRHVLHDRGWTSDADNPWPCFYLDLRSDAGPHLLDVEGGLVVTAQTCPDDRVLVQRLGFENSTFDREKWERMAAGPGYRPELDLVARTADGAPAAGATAWLGRHGGTALLEPLATHPDHRRGGHARHVLTALARELHRLGATGLTVATPLANHAGVTTYQRFGFRTVETVTAMTLGRAA